MATGILGHGLTVVLVGNFNPAIFSPAWLEVSGLITEEDSVSAELKLIHAQVCEFTVKNFNIFVDVDRFQISSTEEPFVSIADWVGVIFGKRLPHTPIVQAGINYSGHFAVASPEQRHALGRHLAPIEPWGEWGKELEGSKEIKPGGLRSITMLQPQLPDRQKGHRQVQLEPSVRADIVNPEVGVYMSVNDHYEIAEPGKVVDATECASWVVKNLETSVETAKTIVATMRDYAGKL